MSLRALEALEEANVIVGYKTYINLVRELLKDKTIIGTGMREEIARCRLAVEAAMKGEKVAVISSGDAGVYGMAGLLLELLRELSADGIEVEIIPGITAANAAASSLGAPLMHDFAVISLSDLLTPWELIETRLELAAKGDFVTVLYNPKSRKRTEQIVRAREIFLEYRLPETPVGLVRNCKRKAEEVIITNLKEMLEKPIDMLTTVIIGNSNTYCWDDFMITPRGYGL